ncbi:MAG: CDGSH iron-sulfur domain-containing protein [Candidatus Krumholzibacteria bacterium]|nr:CDGSH iron-sulfur domain-containing protein [Candidatus Krumholzibacteria bacterium]
MSEPKIAARNPAVIELSAGKHAYCSCGASNNQPFCDGKHAGTEFAPIVFEMAEDKTVALCQCKRTGNAPYCDGTHAGLD